MEPDSVLWCLKNRLLWPSAYNTFYRQSPFPHHLHWPTPNQTKKMSKFIEKNEAQSYHDSWLQIQFLWRNRR